MTHLLKQRLEKERLFQDLAYTPHPGQLLVHSSKARHRVLACGTRWGKSTCAAMEVIALMLEPRESALGWLVAPTYDLTKRIYDRVAVTIQQHLGHRLVELLPREHTITISNLAGGQSVLRAKSADHPVSLLGEGLDWLVVDEAAQLSDATWNENLSPRLIDRQGSSLLLSTPQQAGWFHEAYKRGKGLDPECASWRLPSWDNPHLKREVIEAERGRMPAEKFAQQYEAEFQGVPAEPCFVCGGPRENAIEWVELPEDKEPESVPTCARCGMFVDETGRCIVKYHNKWSASITFDMPWTARGTAVFYRWDSVNADGRWER